MKKGYRFLILFIGCFCVSSYASENKTFINNSQNARSIVEFTNVLDKLPTNDRASIQIATKAYQRIFISYKVNAEAGFRIFREFYKQAVEKSDPKIYEQDNLGTVLFKMAALSSNFLIDPIPPFRKAKGNKAEAIRNKYRHELKTLYEYHDSGLGFYYCEGGWYAKEDFSFLKNKVLNGFYFDLKRFIEFMSQEDKVVICDAALRIRWDELRKRIIRWENFAKKYPSLPETKTEIIETGLGLNQLMYWYLNGESNTPAYEYEDDKLNPELRASYSRFISENKSSRFYPDIKAMYEILMKSNFKRTKELDKYFKRYY